MTLKTVIFSVLTLIALVKAADAQPYPSNGGRFVVDQIEGCVPFTINVTAPDCTGGISCDMDYEGNNQFQNLTYTHTYTQPGTYRLQIVFGVSGSDYITITANANTEPTFDIYSCGSTQVQVKVTDTNYDSYSINYNDGTPAILVPKALARDNHTFATGGPHSIGVQGVNTNALNNCTVKTDTINVRALTASKFEQLEAIDASHVKLDFSPNYHVQQRLFVSINNETTFTQLQNVYNTNTETLAGLTPDNNYYCFRLDAFNPCNNTSVPSTIICSPNFHVTPQNNVNKLTWTTGATGINDFAINRTPAPALTAAAAARALDDTNVQCGSAYNYQLIANYANGARSISLPKSVTAISTNIPAVIDNISAMVDANSVVLEWIQDPAYTAKEYTIRKSSNGTVIPAGTSKTPSFTAGYSSRTPACYIIGYTDACQNNSPASAEACPIILTGALQSDNAINLSWSAYTGWKNGVSSYTIEKYTNQGELISSFDVGNMTSYTDANADFTNQVSVYRIIATPNDGVLKQSTSNTIELTKEPNLYYPSAFTPNGDGTNDTFRVFSQYTAVFELRIFNRWGELLFSTTDPAEGWDGTYRGNLMPEGTYVFRAKITDLSGREFNRSGSVVLLKK